LGRRRSGKGNGTLVFKRGEEEGGLGDMKV
jgi:hypothetical protein